MTIRLFLPAVLCLLTACSSLVTLPYARELEDITLLQVLGVDENAGQAARLTVTAAGEGKNADTPTVLISSASTLSAAVLSLETQGVGKVSLAYVGELLLGEGAAQHRIAETLHYALGNGTIGLDATVWVVRGTTAASAINGIKRVSERLTALETNGGLAGIPLSRSVKETAVSLSEYNCAFVPALTLQDGVLTPAGYAIIRDGALLGYVDGGAVRGVELLLGEVVEHMAEVSTPAYAMAALKVTAARTTVTPVFDGNTLTGLSINCTVKGKVAQMKGEAGLEELRAMLEKEERDCLFRALKLAQGLKADYLNLKEAALLSAPWHKAAIEKQWDAAFSALPLSVTVTAELQS